VSTLKILSRYIFKESLLFFGIALFAFTAVLLTVQMLRFASLIINKGVGFYQIAEVFISIIPTFLEIAVPMAALLGVMLAFARLSGDSEIVVMRSSGVSLFQLIWPVTVFACFVLIISLCVSIYLRPWGYAHLNKTLFEIARSRTTAGLDPGVFSKLGNLTVYAEGIEHHSGVLTKVLINDRRDPQNTRIIIAQSGRILSNEETRTITFDLYDGDIHEILDGKYIVTTFDTNNLEVGSDELLESDGKQSSQKSQEMSIVKLKERSQGLTLKLAEFYSLQDQNNDSIKEIFGDEADSVTDIVRKIDKLSLEMGRRFSIPFASFLLVFLGMPLGVHPPRTQRTWGIGLSSALGLVVFVVYYGILSIGMAMAEGNRINPHVALWLPNLIALSTSAIFTWKIASESWQSVADGVLMPVQNFMSKTRGRWK